MQKIIKKTKQERLMKTQGNIIKVNDTYNWYWVCEKCEIAFFGEDLILHRKTEGYFCLNKRITFFGEKICNNQIYGGDKESFNKYYKLASNSTPDAK